MIPNWFFDDGHMTAMGVNTFTVYMLLVRHANYQSKECNPSYSSIQKKARIGRTAISGAIKYLTQYGYIQILRTGNATQSSSTYKVLPFNQIKGINQSHIGLVLNRTSPKDQSKLVPNRTATSPNQDCELVPNRTLNIQTLKRRIEKDKEEKDKEIFLSDSLNQNQAMQEVKPSDDGIADQEDPTPLPPAPLSEAAIALKAKFEAKFDRRANKYEPQGLTIAGYGEWHLGDRYNNWKPSLIAVAQKRKRDANQTDTPKAATDYIYNMARDCYRELHWGKFENLISDAIEYEKALAANPTQSQEIEVVEPIVYDHHYPWQHFYPMKARFSQKTSDTEIIWGMINSKPPDPVDERCQKFLEKVKDNPERLAKLLTAKHIADSDFASYEIQANDFANAIDGLIAALNQEIEKLLQAV